MEEYQTFEVTADPWTVFAFLFYIVLMIIIGLYSARFSSGGIGEFFIGGRKMKSFVVALSAVVSGRSAWLVLGVTGMTYLQGLSAVWAIVGYTLVELFMFLYGAKRLRRYTERLDNVTVPDYFAARFRDSSNLLRLASGIVIVIFMILYVAAQFDAGGKAFAASFGFSNQTGVIITALIVILYTMVGGFLAVSLTDVVQAMFMIVALLVIPVIAVLNYGGLTEVLRDASAIDAFMVDPLALGVLEIATDQVFWLVLYAWSGLGASFGPSLLLSLFWARTTKWGVLAGIISGTLITIIWKETSYLNEMIYELIPAFTLSAIIVVIVSLLTRAPEGVREELEMMKPRYRRRARI